MGAGLYDTQTLIQAGIDPKAVLPSRRVVAPVESAGFKENNRKLLRIIDEQDAINRFTWYNLPNGLNSRLLERILYYRGQGMFFYMKETDQFFFLPYALDGSIDVYGRFTGVTPLPFNGKASADGKEKVWIKGLIRKPQYDIMLSSLNIEDLNEKCVLLKDYSEQISQTNIARQILNDPLLDIMADCIPFMRTALLSGTGVSGMRVQSQDEQSNVKSASRALDVSALRGDKWIPIIGAVEFQELSSGNVSKCEEFLLAMQGLDSYRLSTYGLPNGGLFQKKAHMLEAEQNMNTGTANLVLQDSLKNRQDFCDIVNSIWGLGIWCEINESVVQADMNGDGLAYDNNPETISYESENGGEEKDVE